MKEAPSKEVPILIVAGEASGDTHAASLVRALRNASPEKEFDFFGATGTKMRAAGVASIVDSDQLAILGLWEIGRALPKFWRAFGDLKRAAEQKKPVAAILVDWPDFNLRLARWLHARGIPVIYYISPQLWAWRSYRARNIQRDVDLLLSILPFEKDWYAARGVSHVEYVGHPLTGSLHDGLDREEFCRQHDLDPARPIIALLPGSRHKELVRILPPMLDAAALIHASRADAQFIVVVAPNRDPHEAQQIVTAHRLSTNALRIVHQQTREALANANVAAVASGTATLEAALLGTPVVIVYKESAVNWHALGSLITTEHFGLVNLIAGRRVATELIQDDFTGESLSRELLLLLEPDRNARMRSELSEAMKRIGEPGASDRAAKTIIEFINKVSAARRQR
ncbi:MAG TPA: lipid-A-disaccharide synthase [Pyrinomonadaceae bacterium]|jgi:lipid-A-disaccharide synthase|nr:lipid-A-disaccharide synthase [Pyrinomonadaceae bacterium]